MMEKGCISGSSVRMGSSFHRYISWSQANCKVNWVTKKAMHLQIVFVDIELFYTGGFFSLQTLSPWFLLKTSEEVLESLESNWEPVQMQTIGSLSNV